MFASKKKWNFTQAQLLGTGALMLSLLLPTAVLSLPANAIELGNGRRAFERTPHLIRSVATNKNPSVSSTYQFTISVPEDAGEPLKAVTISQKTNLEQIEFNASQSRAFIGDSVARGQSIPLASVGGSETPDEVTIVFDQPVAPGNTVTVSLDVRRNPQFGGIYQFGVTVFPVGEDSPGLYLGSTRLQFYGSN